MSLSQVSGFLLCSYSAWPPKFLPLSLRPAQFAAPHCSLCLRSRWQLLPSLACTLCCAMNTDTLLKVLTSLLYETSKDSNIYSKYHVTEDDSSKFQKQSFIPRKVGSWENPKSLSDKRNPSSPIAYFYKIKLMFCCE